ncbi:CRISPR-associated endonuclease Cas3'' [Loktanella sp. SALINAS62]|uniref:CRISPR-associated endonuclease Cas3'' n=1 Tax=Loktanella sp. SALINAS62 TaxID=2706124 RepID=UPI001B8C70CE|nr:CRISPR-associated endonuclease Cas3'' [Loktanella sp. SALINAS62]MBS1301987.1 CRISPR-associated endonuclease Cas3'' [Loktanella sp. SALINAS62]
MTVYAHSLDGPKSKWELLQTHSERVAKAASTRAAAFGLGVENHAHALGLLHDLGKAKPAFQLRLDGNPRPVTHSAEGAKAIASLGGMGPLLAGAIAGHHGALPNPARLADRLMSAETLDLPNWANAIDVPPPGRLRTTDHSQQTYRAQMLVRMLYSCLVDADDRETAAWEAETTGRATPSSPETLHPAMNMAFERFIAGFAADTPLNILRAEVLGHVRKASAIAPGLFTLTVPTGGGKTLAALGFALDHARQHGLRRLIYVSPYTSITQQTADVFRAVFDDHPDTVIEHHSDFDRDTLEDDESVRWRIAAASWDAPVIVTTAVQLFESLHAARKRRCRKLHSLAQSVIVLDEAQTLPRSLLRPCLAALTELAEGYGTSIVLCTATQPSLTEVAGFPAPEALKHVRELAPDPVRLHTQLRRTTLRHLGHQTDEALASRLEAASQALLIVDNRVQARDVFDRICSSEGARHLSTLMTPEHRRAVLQDVRARLKAGDAVRLVATSLVEAGVDVDFPLVLRAEAGLDRIAQAAGRCNREGKMDNLGEVLVFEPDKAPPPLLAEEARIARAVLAEHRDDPFSGVAIREYFNALWRAQGIEALDAAEVDGTPGILAAIARGRRGCPYEDIEAAFRMIPDAGPSVIVRDGDWGVPGELLKNLRHGSPGAAARVLQQYTLGVPWGLWQRLKEAGLISWFEAERFGEQFALLESSEAYDATAGLYVSDPGDLGPSIF